jgi:RimJ/RimL family protein N-acetyltransferase
MGSTGEPQRTDAPRHHRGKEYFVGAVCFGDRGDGVIEMVYGTATSWRRRGLAQRVARLAGRWALDDPNVRQVELRIDSSHLASQGGAEKAGFRRGGAAT